VPDRLDTGAMPVTEPHPSPIFDTGPHPDALSALGAVGLLDDIGDEIDIFAADLPGPAPVPGPRRSPEPVGSAVAPDPHERLKWGRFALVLSGVWVVAGALGLAMYFRWFHAIDKTWPDFLVLVYVVACTVAALLIALGERTPVVSALSVAVMSAPFASGCWAAALYGAYVFGWLTP
jgi:hypothetical protein